MEPAGGCFARNSHQCCALSVHRAADAARCRERTIDRLTPRGSESDREGCPMQQYFARVAIALILGACETSTVNTSPTQADRSSPAAESSPPPAGVGDAIQLHGTSEGLQLLVTLAA